MWGHVDAASLVMSTVRLQQCGSQLALCKLQTCAGLKCSVAQGSTLRSDPAVGFGRTCVTESAMIRRMGS